MYVKVKYLLIESLISEISFFENGVFWSHHVLNEPSSIYAEPLLI